ncbi:MAG TPA: pyridoxamine 5'-phosphate oxidase [Opitutae bacterium]|nr:pyridoxamine 5'-phosphate oxidase [Opitutae bacterium]
MDLHKLRREYTLHGLDRNELAADPIAQFRLWFKQAVEADLHEPNAMVLATVSAEQVPSTRVVLLKSFDERGFAFYTNLRGHKARDLEGNPQASATFPWIEFERQVHVLGTVEHISREETEAYFKSRPYGSQLGAWASCQSDPVPDRATLEARLEQLKKEHPEGSVPAPPHWGGLRIRPQKIEFWQGRPNRLHDRFVYQKAAQGWSISRLQP